MGEEPKELQQEQEVFGMLERASSTIKSLREQVKMQAVRLQMFDDMKELFNANGSRDTLMAGTSDGSWDIVNQIDNYTGVVRKLKGDGVSTNSMGPSQPVAMSKP